MSKAISVNDELMDQYGPLATELHMPWERLFQEALEYALPEMQRRYMCPSCKEIPIKGAAFCNKCGAKLTEN